jgi:mannosyltransferase
MTKHTWAPASAGRTRWRRGEALALVAITVVAAVLRFATLGTQSFDGDELYSVWLVSLPLDGLLETVPRTESTPHTYYLLAWAWTRVFGEGEAGIRSLSALAGTATVPLGAWAARRLLSARAGLVVGVLLALNPFMVSFSQQARAYALLGLACAVSFLLFVRALRTTSRREAMGWGLASAAAIAVHYFAVFFVVAEGAALLWRARGRRDQVARVSVACLPAIGVAVALAPLAYAQSDNPGHIEDIALARRVAQLPKALLVGFDAPAEVILAVIAVVLAIVAALPALREGTMGDHAVRLSLFVAGATVTVPLALAIAGVDYFSARYLIPVVLPIAAVVGAGAAIRAWALAATALMSLIFIAVDVAVPLDVRYQRTDWRGLSQAVGPASSARVVVISPASDRGPFEVYFGDALPLKAPEPVPEVVVAALATKGGFEAEVPSPPRPDGFRPLAGFRLVERRLAPTYTLLRFRAAFARRMTPRAAAALALDPDFDVSVWLQAPRSRRSSQGGLGGGRWRLTLRPTARSPSSDRTPRAPSRGLRARQAPRR